MLPLIPGESPRFQNASASTAYQKNPQVRNDSLDYQGKTSK